LPIAVVLHVRLIATLAPERQVDKQAVLADHRAAQQEQPGNVGDPTRTRADDPHGASMNRIEANQFAENWISAWNRKDVNAVLEHYVDDAKFVSPKAATFVGNSVVVGKKALSQYWELAAKKIERIEFTLDHIVWDSEANELVMFYEANLNGVCHRACELMKFDSSGRQLSGEAMYGAPT